MKRHLDLIANFRYEQYIAIKMVSIFKYDDAAYIDILKPFSEKNNIRVEKNYFSSKIRVFQN